MTAVLSRRRDQDVAFEPPRMPAARVIRDDAEAVAVATTLAEGAAQRGRERILPAKELNLLSDAGLFAITRTPRPRSR